MLTAPAQTVKDHAERRLHFSLQDRPGSLNGALDLLRKHGLNMSHIESRPSITSENGYDFFVTLTSSNASKATLDSVLDDLKTSGASDINFLTEGTSANNESTPTAPQTRARSASPRLFTRLFLFFRICPVSALNAVLS